MHTVPGVGEFRVPDTRRIRVPEQPEPEYKPIRLLLGHKIMYGGLALAVIIKILISLAQR